MSSLTIRKLSSVAKERLRVQAARSGISLEAYTRRLLHRAAEETDYPGTDLAKVARQCFGETNGIELKLPPRGKARPPITFD